ncbi:hypothetical protein ACF07S_27965 [Streptomyces sp. NPDC016640]|uniref:hypothetical protein n=1 Tax=Streptomyces sp. NPDC016640 TaxID=3364969 RepID=UPI003701816B
MRSRIFARTDPDFGHQRRTVPQETITPGGSIDSSTSRKPSGKRKYSHTQWVITPARYR